MTAAQTSGPRTRVTCHVHVHVHETRGAAGMLQALSKAPGSGGVPAAPYDGAALCDSKKAITSKRTFRTSCTCTSTWHVYVDDQEVAR